MYSNNLDFDNRRSWKSRAKWKVDCNFINISIIAAGDPQTNIGNPIKRYSACECGDLEHKIFGVMIGPDRSIPHQYLIIPSIDRIQGADCDSKLAVGLLRAKAELPATAAQLQICVAN